MEAGSGLGDLELEAQLAVAASRAGMEEKTARKYVSIARWGRFPVRSGGLGPTGRGRTRCRNCGAWRRFSTGPADDGMGAEVKATGRRVNVSKCS
jgi:hypothetical protein